MADFSLRKLSRHEIYFKEWSTNKKSTKTLKTRASDLTFKWYFKYLQMR